MAAISIIFTKLENLTLGENSDFVAGRTIAHNLTHLTIRSLRSELTKNHLQEPLYNFRDIYVLIKSIESSQFSFNIE